MEMKDETLSQQEIGSVVEFGIAITRLFLSMLSSTRDGTIEAIL